MLEANCQTCGGARWVVLHRQGDPVPGTVQTPYTSTVYANTVYAPCPACCVLTLRSKDCP